MPSDALKAHYLQHEPQEGLGGIESWLRERGCEIRGTMLHEGKPLPDVDDFDLLVIMGGGMSVNDERHLPWLRAEKDLIRRAIEADKKLLGVCLGAQLIASALGAWVYPNAEKEIGWHEIRSVDANRADVFRFPASCEAFHWHGETFDLPEGAVLLAESEACRNQAFQIRQNIIGLQFHLEATPETARQFVSSGRSDLTPGKFVQSEEDILSAREEKYTQLSALMGDVLAHLVVASA